MKATSSFTMLRTRGELLSALDAVREMGRSIALVPTMGALHEGHLSLIERARQLTDETIVSVFVNRLQFGDGEDFSVYPRDLDRDVEACAAKGVRLVFAPDERALYPEGEPVIRVDPGEMGRTLCGAFRPGHFRGVLTVVATLFGLTQPKVAVFGRKDFQQAILIRRMVEDLELGVHIEIAPLVRDTDGVALSSRNACLSANERRDAAGIWQALSAADRLFGSGEGRSAHLLRRVRAELSEHSLVNLQYVECVNPETLESAENAEPGSVIAMAAFCGTTRLIDNVVLGSTPDPTVETDRPNGAGG